MKKAVFFCACLVFGVMSCAKSDPRKTPAPVVEAQPQRSSVGEPMARKAAPKNELPKNRLAFRGKALAEALSKPGAAEQGEISLVLNRDEAGGTLAIAGSAFELTGEKQGDDLRLWAVSEPGDPARVRRGYLIGKAKDSSFEGTFTISGNAGVPVIRGSWSADTHR